MTKTITPSRARHESTLEVDLPEPVITKRSGFRTTDPDLRDQLAAWIDRNDITRIEAGKALGFPDGTAVSKYLGNKYDRDPIPFENRLREVLAAETRSRHFGGKVLKTNVVEKLCVFADRIRQTGTCGVFSGEAGIGKTVGISAYIDANPTAIAITINALQNDSRGVKQLLWSALSGPDNYNLSHYDWIVAKIQGSNRPIIIDNAQRLAASGRAFLFDLHDLTGCPELFIGNPQILDQISRSDQEHSRVPKHVHAELKEPKRVTRAMIAQHLEDPDQIIDLALQVVSKERGGHLRALNHLLADMRVLMELPANAQDPRGCFLKALAASIDHKSLAA